MSARTVPLYSYDGTLLDHVGEQRAGRLEHLGRAKVVRHSKGHINRVILLRRRDETASTPALTDYLGKKYSFRQPLNDGHRCWRLKALGRPSEINLAPVELRPIFMRVLLECLSPAM